MKNLGHEVFICTTPLPGARYCIQEKNDWVEEKYGHEWTKRMIFTKDKTLVHGDYLIDDMPKIKGVRTPSWEHILYSTPSNRNVTDKRRLTWQNYTEIFDR